MKLGPVEIGSIDEINLLGSRRFVSKTSNALVLLQQSPEFMNTCRNITWIVQSRFCIAANRISRRVSFGRVVHLDLASTRVSTAGLASFLVNEAKWIELKYKWTPPARLTHRLFRTHRKELDEELICLQHQIKYLKEEFPNSPLIDNLQFTYSLLREHKFYPSICYWLERSC
jgi:hypothetical protein